MNADVLKTILGNKLTNPLNIANAAKSSQASDGADSTAAALSVAQTVDTIVNLVKKTPFGTPLSLASLVNQSYQASNEIAQDGKIQNSTLYAIAADTASLLTTVAVGFVAGASAPVVLSILAAGTVLP